MAWTEFYVQTTGSNLNAGSTTADAALFTFTNGDWDATTGIFTATGADLSGITVGMFASVYLDAATVGVFVGRITAVDDTLDTITVSLTAKAGTAPTTGATGRTIKVGGAWKGPNAAEDFPFDFVESTLTNAAGDFPRVNMKGGTNYNVTAAITHADNGPMRFEGYTTTVGDGGRATIDGGTSGASYLMLTVSGASIDLVNLIFQNNGATGTGSGISITGSDFHLRGVVVNSVRNLGITASVGGLFCECETYSCNQSNTAGSGGMNASGAVSFVRCVSHDNSGSNSAGFRCSSTSTFVDCIADTNGADGFVTTSSVWTILRGCDSYNNGGDGVDLANASPATHYIENCNLVKNGGYGINGSGAGARNGAIINCGFGSGTQANTSGQTNGLSAMETIGSITYAADVTPWVDPADGDFRINLAAAKGAGRGKFTQTQSGYGDPNPTVGYPDVGAAQHQETAAGLVIPVRRGGTLMKM